MPKGIKGFIKGHIPANKGKKMIFVDPEGRARKIGLAKKGVKRPPLSEDWKRKISESGKLSNSGKYIRTDEIKEKLRMARLRQVFTPEQKQRSIEALLRASKVYVGVKHHNWKGGISSEVSKIRSSRRYRAWRTKVFVRDKYTCVICFARNGRGKAVYLEADHIKPFAYFPELRFDPNNGRTLCKECHKSTTTYGNRYKCST